MALISVTQATGTGAVTVPSDATAVAVLFGLDMGTNNATMTSFSLGGAGSFTIWENIPTVSASFERCIGVATAEITTTGSQTFTPTPGASPSQGPQYFLCWLKDITIGDLVRGTGADATESTTPLSISCASNTGDVVLAIEAGYGNSSFVPSTASGWTSQSDFNHNSQGARVSSCNSPGASSTTFDAQSENWSGAAIIAIKGTGGGFTLTADPGTYSLAGQDVGLRTTRTISADQGTYSLAGQDVTLTKETPGAFVLTADSGTYLWEGKEALADYAMNAEGGTYAWTGRAVQLRWSGAPEVPSRGAGIYMGMRIGL